MMVCPSGGAFDAISAPIVPEAPGRFSTKNGWSQRPCSFGPSSRATMSGPVPGVNGTTIRTGRFDGPWRPYEEWSARHGNGEGTQKAPARNR